MVFYRVVAEVARRSTAGLSINGATTMPACARSEIVRQGQAGIFHVFSRCVRQAFLLGIDSVTGRDYNHRRDWFVDRLQLLTANFAIDVGFAAIMSNHFHLVLRTSPRLVKRMDVQRSTCQG